MQKGGNMKDYSMDFKESKTFILNYDIEDDKIIIHLASLEEYVIPYTKDNEKKILEKMKHQILDSKACEKKQKNHLALSICTSCAILITLVAIYLSPNFYFIPNNMLLLLGVITEIPCLAVTFNCHSKLKDILKNRTILENLGTLNANIRRNENMLLGISDKAKKLVESKPKNEPVFTPNTADDISYNDLETIFDNINREDLFNFNYHGSEEKPKTLSKIKK